MSQDLITVDREVYSILDWLGDLGGLFEGLFLGCGLIMFIATYKAYDSYMVSQLFAIRSEASRLSSQQDNNKLGAKLSKFF